MQQTNQSGWVLTFKENKTDKTDFPEGNEVKIIDGACQVQFDKQWGGPATPVVFDSLQDWTKNIEQGIKYFSGTAVYKKSFDIPAKEIASGESVFTYNLA